MLVLKSEPYLDSYKEMYDSPVTRPGFSLVFYSRLSSCKKILCNILKVKVATNIIMTRIPSLFMPQQACSKTIGNTFKYFRF